MESVCEVITELSGDSYPTCSFIIPTLNCMIGVITESKTVTREGAEFKKKVLEQAREKKKKFENNLICTVSTILHPRFKRAHNKDIGCVALATQFINKLLHDPKNKTVVPSKPENHQGGESSKLWSYHEKLVNSSESHYSSQPTLNIELKQFFDQSRIKRQESAVKYWETMSLTFPLLYKIGQKYTSLIGTSIPSERVFSTARLIKSDLRNRLTGEHLNRLVFLGTVKVKYWNLSC